MIRKLLSKLISTILLEINCIFDYFIFKKFYTKETSITNDKKQLESWVLQDKHRIEKAFSLPAPRFGFGKNVIIRLSNNLSLYKDKCLKDDIYYIGIGAFKAYEDFHLRNSKPLPDFFINEKQKFDIEDFCNERCNSVGYFVPTNLTDIEKESFISFSSKRTSCRNYDKDKSETIDSNLLKEIMTTTITAPSVCNRQHWHVHFFKGENKRTVLDYQNGNTGFSDNVPMVALVTSDIRSFYSGNERNQPYTDGGLFAMNLMYAMQSYGLSSCPLNWCSSYLTERKFRKFNLVPENEVVVLAIAFGYSSDNALYAKSPRLNVESFYTIN
ncbi:nitroreductase family protein [uncultured Shewanella sp.]|uniref:nitroreductase family protein n=1 Tax=uncultured Shewanella sp. TaxID=173975 RepID=UPI00260E2653|nr:nitroreductase family protein [uncultured Shewanella sp.]